MQDKKIKLTIISHLYPYTENSVNGIFVKDQAEWLSEKYDVSVIAPRPKTTPILRLINKKWAMYDSIPYASNIPGKYDLYRPQYLTYPRNLFFSHVGRSFSKAVLKEIKKKPDIFHVHYAYPDGQVIPGLKKAYPEIPVVLSVHGSDWYLNVKNKKLFVHVKNNMLFADKIITVSEKLRSSIVSALPELSEKVVTVHNGIKMSEYGIDNKAHTTKNNKIRILTVGAYTKVKGIDILLASIKWLKHLNIELTVIGKIPDKKYYQELCKMKKDLGLDDIVNFETAKSREELVHYYRACDFFILPSRSEGFGIVLIEAMFFGKPVISTCSGGPEEIINENNGLLVSPGNEDELTKAIEKMLNEYINFNSGNIKDQIIEKYSSEVVTNKLMNIYWSVSEGRK